MPQQAGVASGAGVAVTGLAAAWTAALAGLLGRTTSATGVSWGGLTMGARGGRVVLMAALRQGGKRAAVAGGTAEIELFTDG